MTIVSIVFLSLNYRFIVSNEIIWFVINIAVVVMLTSLCLSKRKKSIRAANTIAQLLPLFALIYLCIIGVLLDGVDIVFLSLHGLICFLSCYIISLSYVNKRVFRIVCAVLNTIFLLFLLFGIYFLMTLGNIGQQTIVRQEVSPDKSYTAILINSDQGALGGDTLVLIEFHTYAINVGFGQFVKMKPVYIGEWKEFITMRLEWKDVKTLLINGRSYSFD